MAIGDRLKRPGFRLPSIRLTKNAQAGRMSQVTLELKSSDQRILENTTVLRELYEFLDASRKRVP